MRSGSNAVAGKTTVRFLAAVRRVAALDNAVIAGLANEDGS
jgi:hypothetical protein